ncbi:MAG: hypothetical protein ACJAR8_001281, partial [Bacteroidia bacterium]
GFIYGDGFARGSLADPVPPTGRPQAGRNLVYRYFVILSDSSEIANKILSILKSSVLSTIASE